MRSNAITIALATLLLLVTGSIAAPPPTGPVETRPACKWSKKVEWPRKWDGVWVCMSKEVVHVANKNALSCGMTIYKPDIRIVKFDFSVFPKKRGGDPFGMYAIKSSVDNSITNNNAPQISADTNNLIIDAAGPRNVNADYICRVRMEIRP